MSAKVIDNCFVTVSAEDAKAKSRPRKLWPIVAIGGFVGSGVCFAAGLTFSVLAGLEIVAASRAIAYVTVGILLLAFALAFLGAHALDRHQLVNKDNS